MPKRRRTKRQRKNAPNDEHVILLSDVTGLQRSIASLTQVNHEDSLPRRLIASAGRCGVQVSQLIQSMTAAGREAAFDCAVLTSHVAKALEAAAEEARVDAAQLEAYAVLLEREVEEEEGADVVPAARALLSFSAETVDPIPCAFIVWDSASLYQAVDAALRVCQGTDPLRCTVGGDGLTSYQAGDADNCITIVAVDGEGDVVEGVEGSDVTMSLSMEGASVTHAGVGEVGVVNVLYRVQEGSVDPVTVWLSVCGFVLPGSPWSVPSSLECSVILATLVTERVTVFLRDLSVWLPRRMYALLYRGSRDGMTAQAFHALCDKKGPTLLLVRCDKGYVFGGYAGVSWKRPGKRAGGARGGVCSPDAFIFSVVGPHSPGPVMFPIVKGSERSNRVMYYCPESGPNFPGGLTIEASGGRGLHRAAQVFDRKSYCGILPSAPTGRLYSFASPVSYENVLGQGQRSLTGAHNFLPVEMEVYAVALKCA